MSENSIDYEAVIGLIEENWDSFVDWCGAEWIAENTLKELMNTARMQ